MRISVPGAPSAAQAHSPQQRLEAGVRSKGVEHRLHLQQPQMPRRLLDGTFQQVERRVVFAQAGPDGCRLEQRCGVLGGKLLQPCEHSQGVFGPAHLSVDVASNAERIGVLEFRINALQRVERFLEPAAPGRAR